jgi:hypothetical protein
LVHSLVVVDVDRKRDLVDNREGIFESVLEGGDDYDWVDVAF